jgi:hypothetical protein
MPTPLCLQIIRLIYICPFCLQVLAGSQPQRIVCKLARTCCEGSLLLAAAAGFSGPPSPCPIPSKPWWWWRTEVQPAIWSLRTISNAAFAAASSSLAMEGGSVPCQIDINHCLAASGAFPDGGGGVSGAAGAQCLLRLGSSGSFLLERRQV